MYSVLFFSKKMLIFSWPYEGKKLRPIIMALLKSNTATEIKKLNYVSSYALVDWKLSKKQEKLIVVILEEKNREKAIFMIKKTFPNIEKYIISHL